MGRPSRREYTIEAACPAADGHGCAPHARSSVSVIPEHLGSFRVSGA